MSIPLAELIYGLALTALIAAVAWWSLREDETQ